MDTAIVSIIVSGATAIAALIAPAISANITVKSNERLKRFEIYAPQAFEAVQKLTESYAGFPRKSDYSGSSDYRQSELHTKFANNYRVFSSAAYDVMSFLCSPNVNRLLVELLKDLEGKRYTGEVQDRAFREISEALAQELVQISGMVNQDSKRKQSARWILRRLR